MEIYHKNKDQHDKGLSDEVLKDLLELQRINKIEPKKMDQITDVSSLFKYDMEMRIGDKIRRFKAFSEWIGLYNATSYISETGKYTEEKKDVNGDKYKEVVEVIQAVGIQTKEEIPCFPEGIKPNLVIRKRSIETYQYIWVLKFPISIKMKSSWHLLERAIPVKGRGDKNRQSQLLFPAEKYGPVINDQRLLGSGLFRRDWWKRGQH